MTEGLLNQPEKCRDCPIQRNLDRQLLELRDEIADQQEQRRQIEDGELDGVIISDEDNDGTIVEFDSPETVVGVVTQVSGVIDALECQAQQLQEYSDKHTCECDGTAVATTTKAGIKYRASLCTSPIINEINCEDGEYTPSTVRSSTVHRERAQKLGKLLSFLKLSDKK